MNLPIDRRPSASSARRSPRIADYAVVRAASDLAAPRRPLGRLISIRLLRARARISRTLAFLTCAIFGCSSVAKSSTYHGSQDPTHLPTRGRGGMENAARGLLKGSSAIGQRNIRGDRERRFPCLRTVGFFSSSLIRI